MTAANENPGAAATARGRNTREKEPMSRNDSTRPCKTTVGFDENKYDRLIGAAGLALAEAIDHLTAAGLDPRRVETRNYGINLVDTWYDLDEASRVTAQGQFWTLPGEARRTEVAGPISPCPDCLAFADGYVALCPTHSRDEAERGPLHATRPTDDPAEHIPDYVLPDGACVDCGQIVRAGRGIATRDHRWICADCFAAAIAKRNTEVNV